MKKQGKDEEIECSAVPQERDTQMPHQEQENNRTSQGSELLSPLHQRGTASNPFVVQVEEKCEDCGGSGYDWGSLSPTEPDECPGCGGSGTQIVRRDYLAEALRIAGGKSATAPQREHLEATVQHCRALVQAIITMP